VCRYFFRENREFLREQYGKERAILWNVISMCRDLWDTLRPNRSFDFLEVNVGLYFSYL
jgi:hypothetical protein